jgi:hypothetical protein
MRKKSIATVMVDDIIKQASVIVPKKAKASLPMQLNTKYAMVIHLTSRKCYKKCGHS